jgi:hypothetical protein
MFKSALYLAVIGAILLQNAAAFNSLSLSALPACSLRSKPSICGVSSIYGADESSHNNHKGVLTKLASISDQSVSVPFPSSSLLDNLWGNLQRIQVHSNLKLPISSLCTYLALLNRMFLLDKHNNLRTMNRPLHGFS